MPIDFHAPANAQGYAGRQVDAEWAAAMRGIVDAAGRRVADIGCGGGIYSLAWAGLGAAAVTGVDVSAAMVATAARAAAGEPRIAVRQGQAAATGLPDAAFDIVFARALVHHLDDPGPALAEAWRILRPGGVLIVQDRTLADVTASGGPGHIRGWFLELFPRLLAVEAGRRPEAAALLEAMAAAGFRDGRCLGLWETRKVHAGRDGLAADLRARTGRSLLHELDDGELERLVAGVVRRLPEAGEIRERDRWTVWTAGKPRGAPAAGAL
ncbi:MAG TPA: class I SAM-dependent methyltransferase [Geminicoccaceae bacterium]|nr:class I SAM-dependent methyltransferase [Geminicoccus sp.]HMU52667.1 class I SAM-dependent methyltransferase [Geminicoccaceae bacterium]